MISAAAAPNALRPEGIGVVPAWIIFDFSCSHPAVILSRRSLPFPSPTPTLSIRSMKPALAVLLAATMLGAAPAARTTVWLVGDSTMADKPTPERNPERGWGQLLPRFVDSTMVVRNRAVNGRSTRSFIAEGRWDAVRDSLKAGDYVLIEFGHNDEKTDDSTRYTNPYTAYRRNLERFVAEARARRATPVLFTPIVRRSFNEKGTLVDTHGAYPLVVRDVARDLKVPFVDLQMLTEDLVRSAGVEGSKALYVWVAPGTNAMYPEGRQDDTHLSVAGATEVARLAAAALHVMPSPLARHLVGTAPPRP
jgi:lysophospholipase L1-like esterase